MVDDNVLSALDFAPSDLIDVQAVALIVARAVMQSLHVGDLTALDRVGALFTLAGHEPPRFGDLPPFDALRHDVAVILADGRPVCTIDAASVVRR